MGALGNGLHRWEGEGAGRMGAWMGDARVRLVCGLRWVLSHERRALG